MTTSEPRWLELLRQEAARTSIGRAALRVGYSRPAISQALDGKYPGNLVKMAEKVLAALELPMAVACPYLQLNLPVAMCRDFSTKRAPLHNPVSMIHWRACRKCEHRCGDTE